MPCLMENGLFKGHAGQLDTSNQLSFILHSSKDERPRQMFQKHKSGKTHYEVRT